MRFFQFKKVRTKILAGFSLVILFTIGISFISYLSSKETEETTERIIRDEMKVMNAYQEMSTSISVRIAATRGYVLTGDKNYVNVFQEYTENEERNEKIIRASVKSEEFDELIKSTIDWQEFISTEVFSVMENGNAEQAIQNLSKINGESTEIRLSYEKLAQESQQQIELLGEGLIDDNKKNRIFIVILGGIATILALMIASLTARSISNPIQIIMERMKIIESGDVSVESLPIHSRDELGQLTLSINNMNIRLRELLSEISEVSMTVATHSEELTQSSSEVKAGSAQISITMEELARASETQAVSASTLAEIMETFGVRIQETNQNGVEINRYSKEVLEMTQEGRQLMEKSTAQMESIDQIVRETVDKVSGLDAQSQEISTLVSVIKNIAEQTNLLALNAAIEAARAGEHGRGFSVVAEEVSKLAEQVSLSVTDISEIVERIQSETNSVTNSLREGYKEVEEGTEQIHTTGNTFNQISHSVNDMVQNIMTVSNNLDEITNNSNQISSSIDEIAAISEEAAAGIEQTSASIQQTTSSMEEVNNSSSDLAKLAESLNGLIRQFKV